MKKTSHSHHGTLNELNITPLLDLAFVLLVIFIITTPQLVNHLEMNLPSGKSTATPKTDKSKMSEISVTESGVLLDREQVTLSFLRERLTQSKAKSPEFGVVVRSSDEVDYQKVVSVLDVIQAAGITKVGLGTTSNKF